MHFVPEDAERSKYRGYVRVEGDEFIVRVSNVLHDVRTGRTLLDAAQLDVERALASRLEPHSATLKLRLAQASSLSGFAVELEELVAICCRTQFNKDIALPGAKYYEKLMTELDVVGWNRLRQLSDDLRSLELETKDKAGRTHAVLVQLPLQYETEGFSMKPECLVDAPENFELTWPPDNNRTVLDEVLKQFESFLGRFQAFWDVLDAVDAAACVLEPHHPTRATGRRRLALERHASVQFEVDPIHPTMMLSELNFFGSQASVGVLRERWDKNASSKWDEAQHLHKNLEKVLEVVLPSPKTTKPDEFAVECGICYSYRLEEDDNEEEKKGSAGIVRKATEEGSRIPDRLCENPNCNRPFHAKCLFDWLRALPASRQSFHTVFGPYCTGRLWDFISIICPRQKTNIDAIWTQNSRYMYGESVTAISGIDGGMAEAHARSTSRHWVMFAIKFPKLRGMVSGYVMKFEEFEEDQRLGGDAIDDSAVRVEDVGPFCEGDAAFGVIQNLLILKDELP